MMKGPGDPGLAADPADLWVNEDHFNGGFFQSADELEES